MTGKAPKSDADQTTRKDKQAGATLRGRPLRLKVGERFGRYKLLERLGGGGMGTVYRAHDLTLDRIVALKIPNLGAKDAQRVERFNREAKAAASISHPNLCPVYDVGQIDGVPYLAMGHVDGISLSKALKHGKTLTSRQAASLVRRLAKAMAAAHHAGVLHRDLKPSNIVVDNAGNPVIVDFGLAWRDQADDPRVTKQGAAVGTPAFMSPEQIQHGMEEAGPASDIYSLGVTLYCLLAGRLPFSGAAPGIYVRIVNDPPPPPRSLNPSLSEDLERVCLKAMAKAPAERFESMAAFAEALGGFLRSDSSRSALAQGSVASETDLQPVFSEKKRTKRTLPISLPAVAAIAAGVLAGGALAWFAGGGTTEPLSPTAVAEATLPQPQDEPDPSQARRIEPTDAAADGIENAGLAAQREQPGDDSLAKSDHAEPSDETPATAPAVDVPSVESESEPPPNAADFPSPSETAGDESKPRQTADEPVTAVEPAAPLLAGQELLEDVGLVKVSNGYVLTAEADFAERMRALAASKSEVQLARAACQAIEESERRRETRIYEAQTLWQKLDVQQQRAKQRGDARQYNEVVTKRNELATTIKTLQSETKERELTAARERLASATARFRDEIIDMRLTANEIAERYDRLASDHRILHALSEIEGADAEIAILPSRRHERSLRDFSQFESEFLRWEQPVRREGDKLYVEVRLNDQLTVEMEFDSSNRWTLLPAALASRLGIVPTSADPKVGVNMPDGNQYEGAKMRLSNVRLAGVFATEVECIVLPEELGSARPKLGMSFLRHFIVHLSNDRLFLEPLDPDNIRPRGR